VPTRADGNVVERRVFGTSVQGRPLEAFRMGDPKGVTVAVIGVIHGNEEAGLLITDELVKMQIPKGVNLWVIPSINPDGTALDRRGNANRVDLNRNFPHGWARIGQPGYWQYAGPNRASEPETKATIAFFREIKPALGLWYHQDLNIISPGVGFEGEIRARYGALTGLPMKRITGGRYTGVAATWQKRRLTNSMAFVVELGKTLNTDEAKVHANAVLDVSMMLRDSRSSKLNK
jgi:protein MpaA